MKTFPWTRTAAPQMCSIGSFCGFLLLLLLTGEMSAYGQRNTPSVSMPAVNMQRSAEPALEQLDTAPTSGVIGIGDLLVVQVFDVPELTRRARVDEDGNIDLPFFNTLHVAGMTSVELEAHIAKWLAQKDYVKSPIVSVQILESANRGITILGEVSHPGIYPAYGTRTLADVISMAQGLTSLAGNEAAVIQSGHTEKEAVAYPLRNESGDQEPRMIALHPGDTVIIRKVKLVYVLGAVNRPGGFPIANSQMTVLDALALAEGPTQTAKLNNTLVLHRKPTGMQSQIISVKDMLRAHVSALRVEPGDVIYLPSSQSKTVLLNSIPSVLSASVSAMIYGLYQ